MKHATPGEYLALAIAALILVLVLVVSYMCIQLYGLRRPPPGAGAPSPGPAQAPSCPGPEAREGFISALYYSPSCGSEWSGRRRSECRGITTGVMPDIESTVKFGHGICSGRLGVPP